MDSEEISRPRVAGQLYGRLRDDMTVSDGAFRLWHVLAGMSGARGYCWPGQRGLATRYRWSIHSLKPWIRQLVSAGYLRVERVDRTKFPDVPNGHNGVIYLISNTVAQTGHSTVSQIGHSGSAVSQNAAALLHKQDTGAVAQTGHEIKKSKLSKGIKSNGAAAAALPSAALPFFLKLNRIEQRIWGELGRLVADRDANLPWWEKCMTEDAACLDEILSEFRSALLRGVEIENPGGWVTARWKQIGGDK